MKKKHNISLGKRVSAIALTSFVPMFIVLIYLLGSLRSTTSAYEDITRSVTYANQYVSDFKERLDYSMYLAVIGNKEMSELGDGVTTVNGVVTVNPYEYIDELEKASDKMSDMATMDINRNQITRIKSTLRSLRHCVHVLERGIDGEALYQENMDYLDENIYVLTTLIQDGIEDYIRVETIHMKNIQQELSEKNNRIMALCIMYTIIVIMLTGFFSMKAVNSVIKPIRKLCDMTEKVGEGDFTVKTKPEDIDEISSLLHSFNDMTTKLGDLMENNRIQQENLHLTETRLMQAQINPHFLYNTLDTIVWLAEEKKNEEVVSMVTSLSDFFRTTLSKGRDMITVGEEKTHIESYLKIQQFRYQDILNYEIHIPEEITRYQIPKLTLQPLVENALYHGIKNKRGKGNIYISGELHDQVLTFLVKDDGKGMSEEKLAELRSNIEMEDRNQTVDNFGLSNVNLRIKSYYGKQYGLFIESIEDFGTEARILIQAKENEPFS